MVPEITFILLILTVIYSGVLLLFFIGLFFPNHRTQSQRIPVSVIIAARNEEETIPLLLRDLSGQTYPRDKFEVIVVDDASEDGTPSSVQEAMRGMSNLHLVRARSGRGGLTAKKNALAQGIEKSSGTVLLTLDADCRVLPSWIESIVSYFTPEVGMVIGFSQLGRKGERASVLEKLQALDFLALMAAAQGAMNLNCPLAASGQNLAYRREAYDQVGGFSRIGHRISGDDVLLLQLIRGGTKWKIRFAPSPSAFNTSRAEKTFKGFINQRTRWASNGSYQWRLNKLFFLYVVTVFLVNLALLIGIPAAMLTSSPLQIPLICLGLKAAVEGMLAVKGADVYRRHDLLTLFPIWFLIQIPYVVAMGVLGSLGLFTWKNRRPSRFRR
jgi:cellulose synthase/poly-beta-1,6-N-acetylglucosamine synthase-like glycosyltransferase